MVGEKRSDDDGRQSQDGFSLGSWRIDPETRRVTDGRRTRRLTPKAMDVLLMLVEAKGAVVTRDSLLDSVWPDVTVGDENLTHAIAELRRALGSKASGSRFIETIYKRGYRLVAEACKTVVPGAEQDPAFHLEAYLLCLDARRLIERSEVDSAKESVRLCMEAVRRSPSFAFGHAELAIAIVNRCLYYDEDGPSLERAAEAAKAATRLRSDQATSYRALGYALSALERHAEAREAFRRALSLGPEDFETHHLFARALFAEGDTASAARLAEQAAILRPDDYAASLLASKAFEELGDMNRARVSAARSLDRLTRRLQSDPTEPRARNTLGLCLGRVGRAEEALQAVQEDEGSGYPVHFNNAAAFVQAGEIPEAVERLERIVDQGWRHSAWLRFGQAQEKLRGEARFRRIEAALTGR